METRLRVRPACCTACAVLGVAGLAQCCTLAPAAAAAAVRALRSAPPSAACLRGHATRERARIEHLRVARPRRASRPTSPGPAARGVPFTSLPAEGRGKPPRTAAWKWKIDVSPTDHRRTDHRRSGVGDHAARGGVAGCRSNSVALTAPTGRSPRAQLAAAGSAAGRLDHPLGNSQRSHRKNSITQLLRHTACTGECIRAQSMIALTPTHWSI